MYVTYRKTDLGYRLDLAPRWAGLDSATCVRRLVFATPRGLGNDFLARTLDQGRYKAITPLFRAAIWNQPDGLTSASITCVLKHILTKALILATSKVFADLRYIMMRLACLRMICS